jgi:hypothetical protein
MNVEATINGVENPLMDGRLSSELAQFRRPCQSLHDWFDRRPVE